VEALILAGGLGVVPPGQQSQAAFRLRLTPPLRARPEEVEVVVTGRLSRARTVVPAGTAGK
jgi:hypothetical protein